MKKSFAILTCVAAFAFAGCSEKNTEPTDFEEFPIANTQWEEETFSDFKSIMDFDLHAAGHLTKGAVDASKTPSYQSITPYKIEMIGENLIQLKLDYDGQGQYENSTKLEVVDDDHLTVIYNDGSTTPYVKVDTPYTFSDYNGE